MLYVTEMGRKYKKWEYMYTYVRFALLHSKKPHNTVKKKNLTPMKIKREKRCMAFLARTLNLFTISISLN